MLTPTTVDANRLVLLVPDTTKVSSQKENSKSYSAEKNKIEFTKSTKKDYNKKISTAKWNDQQGFTFVSKYQENVLDWRKATPDMFFSNATLNNQIKLPINDFLVVKGEFKTSKFTPHFKQNNLHSSYRQEVNYSNKAQDQVSQGLRDSYLKFGLSGKISLINYGFDFSSIGSHYETFGKKINNNKKDKAGFKYWISRNFNDLNIETSYSTRWNNLNEDLTESRLTDDLIGVKASYTLSTWPYSSLSVGYQTGRQESSFEPANKAHYSGDINIVSADFYISGDSYSVSLGSSLETSINDFNSSEKKIIYNYISASYFSSGFYITPSFYTSNSYFNNLNYSYKSLGTALSISYIPINKPYNISFYVNYDRNKSNDQYTHNDSFSGGLSLDWKIKLAKKNEQLLTFRIEHYNYIDRIYKDSSNSNLFVGVSWQLVSF